MRRQFPRSLDEALVVGCIIILRRVLGERKPVIRGGGDDNYNSYTVMEPG
jgi:hypothetical protein